jgi:hypothetical protein
MRWLFLIIRTQRASAVLRQARYVNPRGCFEEFDNVAHSKHAISHFLWNLATKFALKAHSKLDSVEAIGAEIVNEIGVICYLISIDAEMFSNDALNPVANSTHRFPMSFLKVEAEAYFARFTKSIKPSTGATLQRGSHLLEASHADRRTISHHHRRRPQRRVSGQGANLKCS